MATQAGCFFNTPTFVRPRTNRDKQMTIFRRKRAHHCRHHRPGEPPHTPQRCTSCWSSSACRCPHGTPPPRSLRLCTASTPHPPEGHTPFLKTSTFPTWRMHPTVSRPTPDTGRALCKEAMNLSLSLTWSTGPPEVTHVHPLKIGWYLRRVAVSLQEIVQLCKLHHCTQLPGSPDCIARMCRRQLFLRYLCLQCLLHKASRCKAGRKVHVAAMTRKLRRGGVMGMAETLTLRVCKGGSHLFHRMAAANLHYSYACPRQHLHRHWKLTEGCHELYIMQLTATNAYSSHLRSACKQWPTVQGRHCDKDCLLHGCVQTWVQSLRTLICMRMVSGGQSTCASPDTELRGAW